MFFWSVAEPCLTVLLAIFLITQVILPPFINKPLFWFFRKSQKDLRKLVDIKSEEEDESEKVYLTKEIQTLRERNKRASLETIEDVVDSDSIFDELEDRIESKRSTRNRERERKVRKRRKSKLI